MILTLLQFYYTAFIFISLHMNLKLALSFDMHCHNNTIDYSMFRFIRKIRILHFANQLRQIFSFNQVDSNGGIAIWESDIIQNTALHFVSEEIFLMYDLISYPYK